MHPHQSEILHIFDLVMIGLGTIVTGWICTAIVVIVVLTIAQMVCEELLSDKTIAEKIGIFQDSLRRGWLFYVANVATSFWLLSRVEAGQEFDDTIATFRAVGALTLGVLGILGIVAIVWIVRARARARAKTEAELNYIISVLKEVAEISPEERKEFFGEEDGLDDRSTVSPPKDDARFALPSDRSV
jgi:hypothetical protein